MSKLTDLKIAIVTHEFFKGTGQELRDFLVRYKAKHTLYVGHLFSYAKDSVSHMELYTEGVLTTTSRSPLLPPKEYFLYLRDAFYTLWYVLRTGLKWDYYLGFGNFNALFGLLLRRLGVVDKVVFVTIDYVMHGRFPNKWLNKLYVWMEKTAFFGSDYTWNVSARMSNQRLIDLGPAANEKIQLVVPIGVPIAEASNVQIERKSNIIVYSGSLSPEFGLELAIESMPKLLAKFPDLELRIIGKGVLEDTLKKLAVDLGVQKSVNFVGFIDTTAERLRWLTLLKQSTLGLATYEDTGTTYKRFSDVTKPKDYMACGLPIITTSVIPLSEDVEKFRLGKVVEYNVESYVAGVETMLADASLRDQIEKNVLDYSKDMTWENIFIKVFKEMGVSVGEE